MRANGAPGTPSVRSRTRAVPARRPAAAAQGRRSQTRKLLTPAKVVFRNHLMELLQYEPQTEQVHATPLLASPPWINKYYVMDLAPGRSFIEWAVQHGRTVFAISYINPTADMASTTMDDYLIHGPRCRSSPRR